MKYEAYWISPKGKILPVPDHHIDLVIENPQVFGTTARKISAVYKKHGEPLHMEGFAREEIMRALIKKGWIRIRYNAKPDAFTIQVFRLDKKTKKRLGKWADGMKGGIDKVPKFTGYRVAETGPDGASVTGTLKDLTVKK